MTTPTKHHLTITLPNGKTAPRVAPGKVVYIQPRAKRWRPQSAEVHIITSDWLDPAGYPVVYHTPKKFFAGRYTVYAYTNTVDEHWLFKGIFDADNAPELRQILRCGGK